MASPTTATPAPMPACAPVDNPPDELEFVEDSEAAVYVAVEGAVDLVFPASEDKVVDNGKSFSRQFSWNIGAYSHTFQSHGTRLFCECCRESKPVEDSLAGRT